MGWMTFSPARTSHKMKTVKLQDEVSALQGKVCAMALYLTLFYVTVFSRTVFFGKQLIAAVCVCVCCMHVSV